MNKKLLYIPPLAHLYYLPKFLKDEKISMQTKVSVLFENILLYFFAGLLFGLYKINFLLFIFILTTALLLSPIEWRLIKFSKRKITHSITNWEHIKSEKSYYFLQYQLLGYIVFGCAVGMVIASFVLR